MTAMTTEQELDRKKRAYCLGRLRDARALVLRDGEAFHEAATSLEQIGQVIGNEIRIGLGTYRDTLLDLAEGTGRHERGRVLRLFQVVCEARNMAVHEGAWARHLNWSLIDLFLILEEAIMATTQTVEDIMVRNPVVAEPWHMITHVRREMLANSFSSLPIFHGEKWWIITDADVMQYLGKSTSRTARDKLLETNLGDLIEKDGINYTQADVCHPSDTIPELLKKMGHLPVLVIEDIGGEKRLVGIVTPFDLL